MIPFGIFLLLITTVLSDTTATLVAILVTAILAAVSSCVVTGALIVIWKDLLSWPDLSSQ